MNRIVFTVIGVVLLLLLVLAPSRLFAPLKSLYFFTTRPIMSFVAGASSSSVNILNMGNLVQENKTMKNKLENIDRLAFERDELEIENERLRALLGLKTRLSKGLRRVITSEVVGRSPSGWKDTVLINKGSKEGIKVGMPVLTYSGLVGRIGEVLPGTSKVRLLTHPRFRVGALVQRTRHTGIVYGTVGGECRMKYISMHADIQVGDLIETAGFSEDFPKGLLIGSVNRVWKEPGQIYRVASIKLAADIDRLEEVLCVVP